MAGVDQEGLISDLIRRNQELTLALRKFEESGSPASSRKSVSGSPTSPKSEGCDFYSDGGSIHEDSDTTKTSSDCKVRRGSADETQPRRRPGRRRKAPKRPLCPWSEEEHEKFVVALERFRTDETEARGADGRLSVGLGPGIAELISVSVGTRNVTQVRSHAQKYFQKIRKGQGLA
eukprot:1693861-Rhodomonas_salina.2